MTKKKKAWRVSDSRCYKMSSGSGSRSVDHRFGKISVEDAIKPDESHLEGLSPTLVELYNQTLNRYLTGPWEGTVKCRKCHCVPPIAIKLTTEWHGENRGRTKSCNYICLVDGPLLSPTPFIVDFLIDRLKKSVASNVVLRRKLTAIDVAANSLFLAEEQTSSDGTRKRYLDDRHILAYDDLVAEYCPGMHNP